MTTPPDHDRALASAFDGQAARFEKAPLQSDPDALRRLVEWADLTAGSTVFDAGCGPGLVASAFLEAGHSVVGVDLSKRNDCARLRLGASGSGPEPGFAAVRSKTQRLKGRSTPEFLGSWCITSSTRFRSRGGSRS